LTRTDDETQPRPAESAKDARRLDSLVWSDAPGGRQVLGGYEGLPLSLLARVVAYDGDFAALKRYQGGGNTAFLLQAEGHPTLTATMGSGGITNGRGEAWVILHVTGEPIAGVAYHLRPSDSRWLVRGDLPAR
jgi:hypothetical protein